MRTWDELDAIAAVTGAVDHLERGWLDATVIAMPSPVSVVVSSDQINIAHAYPGESVRSLVRRGMTEAVSDIAASGATLHGIQIDTRAPHYFTSEDFAAVGMGVDDLLGREGGLLLQGSNMSYGEFGVSATAIGVCEPAPPPLRRDRARVGDVLALSGPVGGWNAALAILNGGVADDATDDEWGGLVDDFVEYESELAYGRVLRLSGVVRACVDLNDGLGKTAIDLARASDVHVTIELASVPQAKTVLLASRILPGFRHVDSAIAGISGDDRLLFTVSERGLEELRDMVRTDLGRDVHVIGRVERGSGVSLTMNGARIGMPTRRHGGDLYEAGFTAGRRVLEGSYPPAGQVLRGVGDVTHSYPRKA